MSPSRRRDEMTGKVTEKTCLSGRTRPLSNHGYSAENSGLSSLSHSVVTRLRRPSVLDDRLTSVRPCGALVEQRQCHRVLDTAASAKTTARQSPRCDGRGQSTLVSSLVALPCDGIGRPSTSLSFGKPPGRSPLTPVAATGCLCGYCDSKAS